MIKKKKRKKKAQADKFSAGSVNAWYNSRSKQTERDGELESAFPSYGVFQQIVTEHLFYANCSVFILDFGNGGGGGEEDQEEKENEKKRKRDQKEKSLLSWNLHPIDGEIGNNQNKWENL